jgi:hypothetical protein
MESYNQEQLGKGLGLVELIHFGSLSQAVYVAAELGIADHLADGPKDVTALALTTGTHLPSLQRLLRVIASLDICVERDDSSFALGSAGAFLRGDTLDSLRFRFLYWGRYQWPVWGNLLYSVKTGKSARNHATGTDGFNHLEHDAEAAEVFNRSRVEHTRRVAAEVLRVYSFTSTRRVVDVGGGHGALLSAVLEAYPGMKGVLFDMQHAMDGARAHLENAGLAQRCECVSGSFFDAIPGGADTYMLKSIIHDWNDERSTTILRNCRRAIPQDGKLLLVERIMPARLDSSPLHHAIAQADLTMLLGAGGQERSEAEFHILLKSTGFRLTKLITTALEFSIIEGVPV